MNQAIAIILLAVAFLWTVLSIIYYYQKGHKNKQLSTISLSTTARYTDHEALLKSSVVPNQPVHTMKDGRIVVDVTPEYLISFYKDHTNLQAGKLIEPYINKWMVLHGVVNNISDSAPHNFLMIHLKTSSQIAHNAMYFDRKKWLDCVATLKKGDHITVLGQIDEVDNAHVMLEHCELVDGSQELDEIMTKRPNKEKPPKDINQLAAFIVSKSTEEKETNKKQPKATNSQDVDKTAQ